MEQQGGLSLIHHPRIVERLQALGRLAANRALRRTGRWALAGMLACAGLAVLCAHLGLTVTGAVVLAGGVAAALGAGVWELWRRRRWTAAGPGGPPAMAAALAERLVPELGSGATSAVNLAEQMAEQPAALTFSPALAEAHLQRLDEALGAIDWPAVLAAHERPGQRRQTGVLFAAAVGAIVLVTALGQGRNRLISLILDPRAARLSDVPLAADIQLTYHYPQYTRLPPRVVQGGDGSIQAVAGTDVVLQATADKPLRRAALRIESMADKQAQDIPLEVTDGRHLQAHLSVLRDAQYHFIMVDTDGEVLEDRQKHAIRAVLDEFPEIHLDAPSADVELRDAQVIQVQWHAKDDFGLADLNLVVQRDGDVPAVKIALPTAPGTRHEGTYRWQVSELRLEPGQQARFHLDIADNDAIAGPKHSVSVARRLVLFSARQQHEALAAKQQEALDALVDWLGAELVVSREGGKFDASQEQRLLQHLQAAEKLLQEVNATWREDKLTKPQVADAFANVLEHVQQARIERAARQNKAAALAAARTRQIEQAEKDIIYLDDLLAITRLDELKQTAKELLTVQRDLQGLLQQFRQTQNPALKQQLKERIGALRQKMMDLLGKMGAIKKSLPGEYRNVEAASMSRLDDTLKHLEKTLEEGNLDAAAKELEQLSNTLENMVNALDDAAEEYGGDRYKDVRDKLAEFADKFQSLENEQQELSRSSDKLLKAYRQKTIAQAGKNLDSLMQQARAETKKALQGLDEIGSQGDIAKAFDRDLDTVRQGLLDLDTLLSHHDFAEARQVAQNAQVNGESLMSRLEGGTLRHPALSRPMLQDAARLSNRSLSHTREVSRLLDRLFPQAQQVLSPEELGQMQRLARKQQAIEQQAQSLQESMDKLSEELPIFGGEPRANLDGARQDMGQAARDIQAGELPGGANHGRRATEALAKIRSALERGSQGGGKGLPLPMGNTPGPGQNGSQWSDNNDRDVQIPNTDRNRATPRFRQDLLEAAKQKPPVHYEDAVRRYYEELIR